MDIADLMAEILKYAQQNPPTEEGDSIAILATHETITKYPKPDHLLQIKEDFVWIEFQATKEWEWTAANAHKGKFVWRLKRTLTQELHDAPHE